MKQWRRRRQQYMVTKKVLGGLAVLGGVYTVFQVGGAVLSVAGGLILPVAILGGIAYGVKKILDSTRKSQRRG